jgi:hypothetical protein
LQDFSWWSGLSLSRARRGIALNKQHLACEVAGGQAYWFSGDCVGQLPDKKRVTAHLLPAFDEYTIAYKNRSDVLPADYHKQAAGGIFKPVIVVSGQLAGTWKRTINKTDVLVGVAPFGDLSQSSRRSIRDAAGRYARFIGKELILKIP